MTPTDKPVTLAARMEAAGLRRGQARAVFSDGRQEVALTHAELFERARRLAAGFAQLGLTPGDVIAVQMPLRLATMTVHAAAAWLGLVIVPVIHIYEGAELSFILRQSGAKALVTPGAWRGIDFARRRAAMSEQFPHLVHIVEGEAGLGGTPLGDLLAHDALPASGALDPAVLAMLFYTSGTTSDPKGVMHSHASLLAELDADQAKRGHLVLLGPWPPGHVAGVLNLMRFWVMGQDSVYLETWNPSAAARLIEEHRIQASSGTPYHIAGLLDAAEAEGRDISSLTNFMAGATMVPAAIIQRCEDAGLATYRSYGLSEHPTVSGGCPDDPIAKRLGTDGRLNPGVEVRIVDDADRDVPQGETGEILTRGPDRFMGYFDAALDRDAFTADGWLRTGDLGRLDAEGYLSITDRKKDVIIRGGENIASREVEDLLSLMPGVREAAVVGAPDPRLGERIAAFVVTEPGASLTLEAVAAHFAAQGVAPQKRPEQIHLVDDLPRNASGKVVKPRLRERLRG